jgi:hypothetical protein
MKQHEENRACGLQITILLSVVSRQKLASDDATGKFLMYFVITDVWENLAEPALSKLMVSSHVLSPGAPA